MSATTPTDATTAMTLARSPRAVAKGVAAVLAAWRQLCMGDVVNTIAAAGPDVQLVHHVQMHEHEQDGQIVTCVQTGADTFEVRFVRICPQVIERDLGLIYDACVGLPLPCVVDMTGVVDIMHEACDKVLSVHRRSPNSSSYWVDVALTLTSGSAEQALRVRVHMRLCEEAVNKLAKVRAPPMLFDVHTIRLELLAVSIIKFDEFRAKIRNDPALRKAALLRVHPDKTARHRDAVARALCAEAAALIA